MGHYGAAMTLYAPVGLAISSLDPVLAVACGVGAVSLSRLPDCDRRLPFVHHRGGTHSLAFLVATAASLGWIGSVLGAVVGVNGAVPTVLGAVVGTVAVGSHLLADALTPAGVPLLWPLRDQRYAVALTRAADPVANAGLFVLGVAMTVVVCTHAICA
jgi:inner membrane protein